MGFQVEQEIMVRQVIKVEHGASKYQLEEKILDGTDIRAILSGCKVNESSYNSKTKILTYTFSNSDSFQFLIDLDIEELRKKVVCLQLENKPIFLLVSSPPA